MIVFRFLGFLGWYLWQVCLSTSTVLLDVVSPRPRSTPRLVGYRPHSDRDIDVFLLSVLITLTPGTLTIGVVGDQGANHPGEGPAPSGPDRSRLVVHCMYAGDEQQALAEIEEMELRMLAGLHRDAGVRR